MSSSVINSLKEYVMKCKAVQDGVRSAVEALEKKRINLFTSKKIDFKTHMKLGKLTSAIYELLEEGRLDESLGEIISASNVLSVAPYFALDEIIRGREWVDLIEVLRGLGFNLSTLFEKPLPSVSVGTERNPEERSKPIDNLLYSYTPFKLRGTAGNYLILLLPSTREHHITSKWCDEDARTFYEGDRKILTPNSIRLTTVSELKSIVSINGEKGFRLEIDCRSPTNTYYCRMGLYISPSSRCNRRECYLWDVCEGKKFWKGPKTFYSLCKVVPIVSVKIDSYDQPTVIQSNKFGLSVEIIDNLQAKIYIDSVIFFSSYFTHSPIIKLKEMPGYRITTKGIAFSIDALWIKKFVETVLLNDPQIFAWVFTKYFILNNYDVNDLRRVSTFFWNIITSKRDTNISEYEKGMKAQKVTPELIRFGTAILMHSLAHLIHQEIVSVLQTSPENLVYSYSKKPEIDDKYRVFIIENAERGLGLTQSFAEFVNRAGSKYLNDLADRMNKILAICSKTTLNIIPLAQASSDVRLIWDRVNLYNSIFQLKFGVFVPVEFVRYILTRYDPVTSKVVEKDEVSPYIDDILSITPLCWDGCYHCVRLEAGCHDFPYEQIFDVSKSLLTAFLNEWRESFKDKSKTKTAIEIGEARKLLNYIKEAKNQIAIISPWFSKEVAETICELTKVKGLKFRILTSNDKNVKTHVEALNIFRDEIGREVEVKVLTDRLPHIKMIIIDERLLIIGSANLTLSGLYENIEGYVIIDDTSIVSKSIHSFEELWRRGEDINKV